MIIDLSNALLTYYFYVSNKRVLIPVKGPSINYVFSVGGGGNPKDDLLHRAHLIKRGGGSKIADFETT